MFEGNNLKIIVPEFLKVSRLTEGCGPRDQRCTWPTLTIIYELFIALLYYIENKVVVKALNQVVRPK